MSEKSHLYNKKNYPLGAILVPNGKYKSSNAWVLPSDLKVEVTGHVKNTYDEPILRVKILEGSVLVRNEPDYYYGPSNNYRLDSNTPKKPGNIIHIFPRCFKKVSLSKMYRIF